MKTPTFFFKRIKELSFIRQASWYAGGQITAQIFSFLSVLVTSRYLGPTNVGLASFVQNYLAVFATITAGIDFYFTWKIAKSVEPLRDLKEYIGHKFYVMVTFSIIGIGSAWYVLPPDVAQMATITLLPMFLMSVGTFSQYAVTVHGANVIAGAQIIATFSSFFVKIILVLLKAPLIAFITVSAFDISLAGVLIGLFYFRHKDIRLQLRKYSFPHFLETIKLMYVIRMSIIAIAIWQLVTKIDQLLVALFVNAYSLGIYSAAVKIALVPNFLAAALYSALTMRVVAFAGKEDMYSRRRMRQTLLVYLGIGLAISFGIVLMASPLVHLLYGSQFLEAVPVLRVYAFSIPGMFVLFHYMAVYGAQEKHAHQIVFFSGALLFNTALIFILTPLFGLEGAALATALTYNLLAAAFYLHVR